MDMRGETEVKSGFQNISTIQIWNFLDFFFF